MSTSFKAIMATEEDGKTVARMTEITADALPSDGVLIDVAFSGLNYKDGLALNGNLGKVMRALAHGSRDRSVGHRPRVARSTVFIWR